MPKVPDLKRFALCRLHGLPTIAAFCAATWALASTAGAAIDNSATWGTIPYHGQLTQAGAVVNGAIDFCLQLYAAPTGGTPLWSEQQIGIAVVDGAFAVRLGSQIALNAAVETAPDLYLAVGVRPNTGPAGAPASCDTTAAASYTSLSQRQALGANAFALAAKRAVPGQDFSVDGTLFAAGSPTIGQGIVDEKTTSNGTYLKFADGTLLEWGTVTVSVTVQMGYSGVFRSSGGAADWTFPLAFIAPPIVTYALDDSSNCINVISRSNFPNTTTGGALFLAGASDTTAASRTFHWTAVGRWQ